MPQALRPSSHPCDRWDRANDVPAGVGWVGPALVLLVLVVLLEVLGLTLVLQSHVAQAQARERIRVTASWATAACARSERPPARGCAAPATQVSGR